MLAGSFFIKSSSKLLVSRTGIKAWMSLISGWIRQLTLELLALPWVTKILHFRTWISQRPVGQSWSNFMCSITGGGERLHNVLRQIGSKLVSMATESPHWLIMGKYGVSTFYWLLLIRSFSYLQVTRTCIECGTCSNFGQIGPLTMESAALECLKKFP